MTDDNLSVSPAVAGDSGTAAVKPSHVALRCLECDRTVTLAFHDCGRPSCPDVENWARLSKAAGA